MTLTIPRSIVADIVAHAREGLPDEVCGILAGRFKGEAATPLLGRDREVVRHWRVRNAHKRPRGEFLLDPVEQLRITLEVEDDLGLEIVGFYHSHPLGPARLSTTDAARATWPGASYFLAWCEPDEGVGSWRWDADAGRFRPEALDVA